MKSTIDNWQLLMIRACKKNRLSTRTLRRIYGRSRALSLKYTPIEYVTHGLMEIIKDYDLVKDWEVFIHEIEKRQDGNWYFNAGMKFNAAFLEQCVSVIRLASVNKFPHYPRPAWFKNKYKDS